MCELTPQLTSLLLAGEEGQVFAHAGGCSLCRVALLEQGAYPAGCNEPLRGHRTLLYLDRLVEGLEKSPELLAHLDSCTSCQGELADARDSLPVLAHLRAAPPAEESKLAIVMTCVYCRDHLSPKAAVYCASCLAPHHEGCFLQHGSCCVLGCEDKGFVRRQLPPPPRPRQPVRVRWLVAAVLGAAAAVAAVVDTDSSRDAARIRTLGDSALAKVTADPVVAWIGSSPLLRSRLETACLLVPRYSRLPANSPERLRIRFERLEALLQEELVLQRAIQDRIEFSQEELREFAQDLERREALWGGPAGLQAELRGGILSLQKFHDHYLRQRMAEKVTALYVGEPVEISDDEIASYYARHRESFWRKGRLRLQEIVIFLDPSLAPRIPDPVAERLARGEWNPYAYAQDVQAQLQLGYDSFSEIARRFSMAESAGRMQTYATADMETVLMPPLGRAVNALHEGQTSELVECYTGTLHIVRLVSLGRQRTPPLDEVGEEIRHLLAGRDHERRRAEWLAELGRETRVRLEPGFRVQEEGR